MKAKDMAAGVGIGMAVAGTAAIVAGMVPDKTKKKYMKKANKAMKSMSGMLEDARYMFK